MVWLCLKTVRIQDKNPLMTNFILLINVSEQSYSEILISSMIFLSASNCFLQALDNTLMLVWLVIVMVSTSLSI